MKRGFQSKRNCCISLRNREYSEINSRRRDFKILRNLICHTQRTFTKVWDKHSTRSFHLESGRIFSENYKVCDYGYHLHGGPRMIYKLDLPCKTKIEDALLYRCYHEQFPRTESRPCLLGIQSSTMGDSLVQYDLDTGQLIQKIHLSHTFLFRSISWADHNQTFAIRSKNRTQTIFHRQAGLDVNVSRVIAIFTAFPLQFLGMLEVDKRIFGLGVSNVIVSHGMLIALHQSGYVRFYSLEYIMQKFKLFDYSIHDCDKDPVSCNGVFQSGLPINIKITECPPCLFEVRCADHDVQIGGFPWHYVITPHGSIGYFSVHSLENGKLAKNGELDMKFLSAEPDRAVFHNDNSGRILHIGPTEVRVMQVRDGGETGAHQVNTCTVINLQKDRQPEEGRFPATSSGRLVKKRRIIDEIDGDPDMTIHQVDYEDELDLMWISATYHHPALRGVVRLHDNTSGDLLREVELQELLVQPFEHEVHFDLDTIIQIVKPHPGRYVCTMYRLSGDPNQGTSNNGAAVKSHGTRMTRSGRRTRTR